MHFVRLYAIALRVLMQRRRSHKKAAALTGQRLSEGNYVRSQRLQRAQVDLFELTGRNLVRGAGHGIGRRARLREGDDVADGIFASQ